MKKIRVPSLWITLEIVTFSILFITMLIAMLIVYLTFGQAGKSPDPISPILIILLFSTIFSLILFLVIVKKVLNPITLFSRALTKISKGDFNVYVPENFRIEELKKMSITLNLMVKELDSLETLRNDFIASVSHEFKTPLSAIAGYVSLLKNEELLSEEKQEYIKIIIDSTTNLSQLVSDILDLNKLEKQVLVTNKEIFSIDEQIREVVLLLEPIWEDKKIKFEINMENLMYNGNKVLCFQIWKNLLVNAIKFSHSSSTIHILVKSQNDKIIISIKDEGIGISQEDIPYIFNKFYQVDQTHSKSGNGLGLSLVEKIINLNNGTILVTSALGVGTEISIELPYQK